MNDKGGLGFISASDWWSISNILLSGGANTITVTGTNFYGSNAVDYVTITREPSPGEGTPVVIITTPPDVVDDTVESSVEINIFDLLGKTECEKQLL